MAIGAPRPRTSGGIYNPGGENVSQVYKPQGTMYTGSGNKPPKTIKPPESEAMKEAKRKAKEEKKQWEDLARQQRAEMYRKKTPAERLAEKYRASRN